MKKIHDQPFSDINSFTERDLKSISSVSQKWRQAILPKLFQHARMILPMDTVQIDWPRVLQDFFVFVRKNNLESIVQNFTLVVQDHQPLCCNYDLDESLDSLKIHWQHLFNVIHPASPDNCRTTAYTGFLVALQVDLADVEQFHMPYHILSLQQSPSPSTNQRGVDLLPGEVTLLHLRLWRSLLLNEGAFLRAANSRRSNGDGSYSVIHHKPPSLLQGLQDSRFRSLLPRTIDSMSYIAFRPGAGHLRLLCSFFGHIKLLYVQLEPRHDPFPDHLRKEIVDCHMMVSSNLLSYSEILSCGASVFPRVLMEVRCGDVPGDLLLNWAWESAVRGRQQWRVDPERRDVAMQVFN